MSLHADLTPLNDDCMDWISPNLLSQNINQTVIFSSTTSEFSFSKSITTQSPNCASFPQTLKQTHATYVPQGEFSLPKRRARASRCEAHVQAALASRRTYCCPLRFYTCLFSSNAKLHRSALQIPPRSFS